MDIHRILLPFRKKTVIQCIAGEDTLASLYEEYQNVRDLPKDDSYDATIEQDLPRTFAESPLMKKHLPAVRHVLDSLVRYSPVGYIQGQNFLAAASVFFFWGRLPYLSFWLTVTLFENLKHVYLLPIDGTFRSENRLFADDTERIVRVFLALYRNRHEGIERMSRSTVLVLKNMVQWKLLGTLMFTLCKDLTMTRAIILHYVECLHDRAAFRKRAAAVALAFLICCLLEKELDEEVILIVQNGCLSKEGMRQILLTSENLSTLV